MDEVTPPTTSGPAAGDGTDVAELIAERDALQAQVDKIDKHRRWGTRARGLAAAVLVILFAISFLASGVGIWLHRNTLNRDVWSERVIPLGEDPAVQTALANYATTQLMQAVDPKALFQEALPPKAQILATPLSSAVESFVADKVDQFFHSKKFEELWVLAATKAHDEAVATLRGQHPDAVVDGDKITINLIPMINAVLNDILQAAPGLVGSDAKLPKVDVQDVPTSARAKLSKALGVNLSKDFGTIVVYDGGKLSAAQQAVKLFDRLVVLTSLLTVVFLALALWISPRKRRTIFQLLGATALMCIAIRRVCFLLQDNVTGLVEVEQNKAAASVVVDTFVNPLTSAAAAVLWFVVIAGLIAWITGPYRSALAVRGLATGTAGSVNDRVRAPETTEWIIGHADALRVAGYAGGALLLWFVDLSWLTFLIIALLVVGWQVGLHRVAPSTLADDEEGSTDGETATAADGPPEADETETVDVAPGADGSADEAGS